MKNSILRSTTGEVYAPILFRLHVPDEKTALEYLVGYAPEISVHDEIEGQLRELVKSNNPSLKIKPQEYDEMILRHLDGRSMVEYGVWVYYPWSKKLLHILDEEEFVEVRTNRNRYKITTEEQKTLRAKKVGVVGLSVGQSIALTMAMERTCGELRLADFDTVELSNLNRIRTGLQNLGLKKTVIAAREISEIDPYLVVKIFNDGLTPGNIDAFFTSGGPLDLLVEVCDGLDVKILSRFKARELRIPVIMDTNDRGMLDVERFDLEPGRPILHGLAGDLDPEKIGNLTNEEKIPYILTMIGAESISTRLKASMLEVEQSINTWPQLASSVTLGGAITTEVCRNIFLDQFHDSGRYYVEVDKIIRDREKVPAEDASLKYAGPPPLTMDDLEAISSRYVAADHPGFITPEQLDLVIEAACLAPSGGNSQPWKFLYRKNNLFIFHDAHFSHSLLDYNNLGSYIAFGAMLENIELRAGSLSLTTKPVIFPLADDPRLIAAITFENGALQLSTSHLVTAIGTRVTNRNITERRLINEGVNYALTSIASSIPGAHLQLFHTTEQLAEFGEILTNTERLRFLHPQGQYDTFVNELRFTKEQVEVSADGLDINTLNMKPSDIAALQIARDPSAINFLHSLNQGTGFKKISSTNVLTASSIGVISMKGHGPLEFLNGGRALERVWLEAACRNVAFQPISQIIFMIELWLANGQAAFNSYEQEQLSGIHERFSNLTKLDAGRYPVFVFRLFYGNTPETRSLRRPVKTMFFR